MILDIFSSFDPACSELFSISSVIFWSLCALICVVFTGLWITPSISFIIQKAFIIPLVEELTITPSLNLKGFVSQLIPLFFIIALVNISGLLPYVFRVSSHLVFTLILALPLWLSLIISSSSSKLSSFIARLLPTGGPGWLNSLLLHIEIVRILARPITLAFRLAANITAGHIILKLVTSYAILAFFTAGPRLWVSFILVGTFYSLFESCICILQAYIFYILLKLYRTEHTSSH